MAQHSHEGHGGGGGGNAGRFVFWGFILVVAYFLITEHRAHAVTYLPFLLLAACPLLHLFHGHGGHGGHEAHPEDAKRSLEQGDKTGSTPAQHGGH